MKEKEIQKFVSVYVQEKLNIDPNYIRCTFYEIRIKYDLSEEETDKFLKLVRNYLENQEFNVYFTGSKFTYKSATRTVQPNELFIAFK